ncbi:MAG: DUF126 domain-containing protein [Proteobacteria bacterium]|nr:DUF126 domain-containing protein [Pseudomonadota bacterium]
MLVAAHPLRRVRGSVLHLLEPISFWGGVSPATGRLTDTRSREHGNSITNTILLIRNLRGSSSASSVLLELIYRGLAPAALVLDSPDAILALGALVATELGLASPPILRLPSREQACFQSGVLLSVNPDGTLFSSG